MGTFSPEAATVRIYIDDEGNFAIEPITCYVYEGTEVTFTTENTAARVVIPDTSLVFKEGEQGPGTATLDLTIGAIQAVRAGHTQAKLPYAVFQLEGEKILGGLERAPVIIIVKTSRM